FELDLHHHQPLGHGQVNNAEALPLNRPSFLLPPHGGGDQDEELSMVWKRTTVSIAISALLFTLPVIGYGAGVSGLASVNGVHISYETQGAGPALVLINDGILDRRMWDDQVTAFAAHYQVIRNDFRGWGHSPPPQEPFSFVDDLSRLLAFLH